MKFELKSVFKTDVDENIHEAVNLLAHYFAENPDEPYVELIYDHDGVKEVVGRINNPQFTELIYAVIQVGRQLLRSLVCGRGADRYGG